MRLGLGLRGLEVGVGVEVRVVEVGVRVRDMNRVLEVCGGDWGTTPLCFCDVWGFGGGRYVRGCM